MYYLIIDNIQIEGVDYFDSEILALQWAIKHGYRSAVNSIVIRRAC